MRSRIRRVYKNKIPFAGFINDIFEIRTNNLRITKRMGHGSKIIIVKYYCRFCSNWYIEFPS